MDESVSWQPVRTPRASDVIVAQMRAALFDGRLQPGDSLGSEHELAARFGVSRMSVREAMRTLEATGMVEVGVGSRGGARISQGDPHRFAAALAVQLQLVGVTGVEVLDVQTNLERMAAELAARVATQDDLQRLKLALVEAEHVVAGSDEASVAYDAFHQAIIVAARNRVLAATLVAIRDVLGKHQPRPAAPKRIRGYHQALYSAIAAGDAEEAGRLMQEHMEHIRDWLAKVTPRR
jgi:GntR family transcriptional regulator, transcriptional repressor for pyruvate dehydrogenase complex